MQLLDAGIAFALTIAGLATVVSIIVEIIHRVLSLRAKGLRAMLEQHFDDVIVPVIKTQVEQAIQDQGKNIADELKRLRENLIDKITGNPLVKLQKLSWLPKRAVSALSRYNEVTAMDFLKRLPDTDVFEYIKLRGNMAVDARLKKFDQKYEEYEKAISNYFKRRAQLLSFVVGIALAITVNIHGIRLFERYLNDPELTATVIAQTDKIEAAMESMQNRQAAAPETDEENMNEIRTAIDQYNELMGNFVGLGLPIGWAYYPNCPLDQNPKNLSYVDPQCKTAIGGKTRSAAENKNYSTLTKIIITGFRDPWGFLKWLLVVAITGTLIGLGGPFWFDVARKLSDVRRKFRDGGGPPESSKPEAPVDDADKVIEEIAVDAEPENNQSQPAEKEES